MDRQLIEYLPDFMQEFLEMQIICEKEQTQAESIWSDMETIWDNQFVETADEATIKHLESIMSITSLDTDSMDDRRYKILSVIQNKIPYVMSQLKQLIGDDFSATYDDSKQLLTVRISRENTNQLNSAIALLKQMIPANLLLDCNVEYNAYSTWTSSTYEELAAYTHLQLRTEEI